MYHKYNKSLLIKQYEIIQCTYMRHMGWGPGYKGLWVPTGKQETKEEGFLIMFDDNTIMRHVADTVSPIQ